MTDNKMIKYLRTKGLGNGASSGSHSGTMDLIADRFIELLAENNRQQAEIERLKEKRIEDDKLLNDRVQEAVDSVSKANDKYVNALKKSLDNKFEEIQTANEVIDKIEAENISLRAEIERLKNLPAEEEAKHIETSKCFYKAGIKDFAHTFTERFIIILNLNYEQANVARRCEEELVKGMVGEG